MPHLVQVANVGQVVGGTGACAWTVTRSLPDWTHSVVFRSRITDETQQAFDGVRLMTSTRWTRRLEAALSPSVVLFHNIAARDAESPGATSPPRIQYLHSVIEPARAHHTVCCSRWLAERYGAASVDEVLHQAVPRPPGEAARDDEASQRLRIGRLCTPTSRKWPRLLVDFYASLTERHPQVDWEFVGAPGDLQEALRQACAGRATFAPASWTARQRLWTWDALLYHHPQLPESFGRVVAEALRTGCIPIVDAAGGFVEQLTSDCGFLCTTPAEFSTAITRLLDPHERQRLSRAARERGDRLFSLARFGQQLRQLLARVLASREGTIQRCTTLIR